MYNRRGTENNMTGFAGGDLIDRSHTHGGLPNNSNIGSFAAHKADKHDKTNASHNPMMNWLEDGKPPRGGGRNNRRSIKVKKGKSGDALEF